MDKKSNLYLYTFLGIFLSICLVGGVFAPWFLKEVRTIFVRININANRPEASLVANILSSLVQHGTSKKEVVEGLQAGLVKADLDTSYLCLVNDKSEVFVAHPLKYVVGKNATKFVQNFTAHELRSPNSSLNHREQSLAQGAILKYASGDTEIVNSVLVPNTDYRLFLHENINKLNGDIHSLQIKILMGSILLGLLIAFPASYAALRVSRRYEKEIEAEHAKSDKLLLNILPFSIAERLKAGDEYIANHYDDVSVMFIDMVGFTPLSAKISPEELVDLLNKLFSKFDEIVLKHGLEKIKTIGDAYMVVGGLPEARDDHLKSCIDAGLEIITFIKQSYPEHIGVQVRLGLHTGSVVAGVIGSYKFAYDLWGETVNIASRLESSGVAGMIHCSAAVHDRVKNDYSFRSHGQVKLKGVGEVSTYLLG